MHFTEVLPLYIDSEFDLIEVDGNEISLWDSETWGNNDPYEDAPIISKFLQNDFVKASICPHCNRNLQVTLDEDPGKEGETIPFDSMLKICLHCYYWQLSWFNEHWSGPGMLMVPHEAHFLSKIRTFENKLPDGITSELAQAFRRTPHLWNSYDPKKFEYLITSIFKLNFGAAEVLHVGRPYDGGIDLYYIDAMKSEHIVQIKSRQSPLAVEGVSTIRNLLGTMVIENFKSGILVSNADHFSVQARKAAKNASTLGYKIELTNRGKLDRMIGAALPIDPWLGIVQVMKKWCGWE